MGMIRISQVVRLATIQRTLLRHGFDEIVFSIAFMKPFKFILRLLPWNWFRAEYESRGVRIREVLEELGPIFVKFGQILSTRRDFIPDDIDRASLGVDTHLAELGSEGFSWEHLI